MWILYLGYAMVVMILTYEFGVNVGWQSGAYFLAASGLAFWAGAGLRGSIYGSPGQIAGGL